MTTLAEKFSGYAGRALDKLKHPVDSIKDAWKHEVDRIVYWGTIGDNVKARSGVLKYLDGISKLSTMAVGITALVNPAGTAGVAAALASGLIGVPAGTVSVNLSHYVNGSVADVALLNRAMKRVTGSTKINGMRPSANEDDAAKRHLMQDHMARALMFSELLDLAPRFGATKEIFAMANQVQPRNSDFIATHVYSGQDGNKLFVAIKNLQTRGKDSLDSLDRAALAIEQISNPVLREKYYQRLAGYAEELAQKSMIIPSADNLKRSLGTDFMEKAQAYRQLSASLASSAAVTAHQPAGSINQQAEHVAREAAAFNALPQVQKACNDADIYGIPKERALLSMMSQDQDLSRKYAQIQDHALHTTLKAANAMDIGLIVRGSQDEKDLVGSLRATLESSRDWPMSSVFSMVINVLNKWEANNDAQNKLVAGNTMTQANDDPAANSSGITNIRASVRRMR